MHPERIAGIPKVTTSIHFPIQIKGNRDAVESTIGKTIKKAINKRNNQRAMRRKRKLKLAKAKLLLLDGSLGLSPVIEQKVKNSSASWSKRREAGKYSKNGHTHIRQGVLKPSENVVFAKSERPTGFSTRKTLSVKYAIVEANLVQPSHIGKVPNANFFLPEAQPRDRSQGNSGSTVPIDIANNLVPELVINSASAYTGAPVTNSRGEVIQGNGRAYALKYYWSVNQDDTRGYKKYLLENLTCLGFRDSDKNKIRDMKSPILVRIANVSDLEAIEYGQYQMSDSEAVSDNVTNIKAKVNRVKNDDMSKIIRHLLQYDSDDATLNEIIRKSSVLKIFVQGGVIRADEVEKYTRNGVINADGADFVQKFLLNSVFFGGNPNAPVAFSALPYQFQRGFEKALLTILRIPAEKSINQEISESIVAYREFLTVKKSMPTPDVWVRSVSMYGNPLETYGKLAIELIKEYEQAKRQKDVEKPFKSYLFTVENKPPDLMNSEGRKGKSKIQAIKELYNISLISDPYYHILEQDSKIKTKPKTNTSKSNDLEPKKKKTKAKLLFAKAKLKLISI